MSIYKIFSDKGDKVYYGSTIIDPSKRFYIHKYAYSYTESFCSSFELFDLYGIDNCKLEVVEKCDISIIRSCERWWIENNECVNKILPIKTEEEIKQQKRQYREDHKEENKEYYRKYREEHQDILKEYYRKYMAEDEKRHISIVCECGGSYMPRHKTTHLKTKKHLKFLIK